MPYTLGISSGGKVFTPEDVEMLNVEAQRQTPVELPTTPGPTTRPWPTGGSVMTRPCYPPSTLAMLGAQPQQIPVNKPCPPNFTETAPGSVTVTGTTIVGGKPIGNTSIGTNVIASGGGGGVVKLPGFPSGKLPAIGKLPAAGKLPAVPQTNGSTQLAPPIDTDVTGGAAPTKSWLSQYKWYLVGGGALVVAGITTLLVLRQKKTAPATAGFGRDYNYHTQAELRKAFWQVFPQLSQRKLKDFSGKGKMYTTDTRVTWVDWIDNLQKSGEISEKLANRATLD